MNNETEIYCRHCQTVKNVDQFNTHKTCKFGREPKCKDCKKEMNKQAYIKRKAKNTENEKTHSSSSTESTELIEISTKEKPTASRNGKHRKNVE